MLSVRAKAVVSASLMIQALTLNTRFVGVGKKPGFFSNLRDKDHFGLSYHTSQGTRIICFLHTPSKTNCLLRDKIAWGKYFGAFRSAAKLLNCCN